MKIRNITIPIKTFVLFAYISIGVFGLFDFVHPNQIPMANCPYTEGAHSVCENTATHINNWQQFSKAIVPTFFLFLLLAFGIERHSLRIHSFFKNLRRLTYIWRFYIKKKTSHISLRKIIRYLALFENSPSISFGA